MSNYASGIKADDLKLVGMSAPSGEAHNVARAAPPELRLVEAPASPGREAAPDPGRGAELTLVAPAATPEQGTPSVTDVPPTEPVPVAEPVICIELKPISETTTWGSDPDKPKARPLPRKVPIAPQIDDEERSERATSADRKKVTLVAAAIGCLVVAGGLAVALRSESAPAPAAAATRPAPAVATAEPAEMPTPVTAALPSSGAASPRAADTRASQDQTAAFGDFAGRLQALKSTGNWNVFVIYAAEWARNQPGNPDAWRELSLGYLKLRQFRDALDAAKKAVELAPGSFLAWQSLGKVNLDLQESSAALAAFERAAALNDQDVVSLVQAGLLETRLGRLSEARVTFAKALALSPEDVDALCGAAAVAQKEGRLKDADAIAQQLKSLDGICRDAGTVETVRVTANAAPAPRTVPHAGR